MSQTQNEDEEKNKVTPDDDGTPKFGRLLIVLIFSVFLMAVITWASEAYWS